MLFISCRSDNTDRIVSASMDVEARGPGACQDLEDKLVYSFKLAMDMVRGGVRKFVYDMERPAILNGNLVEVCVDGNW